MKLTAFLFHTKAGRLLTVFAGFLLVLVTLVVTRQNRAVDLNRGSQALMPKLSPQSIDELFVRDLIKGRELHFKKEAPLTTVQWLLEGKPATTEWRALSQGPLHQPELFIDARVKQSALNHFIEILVAQDFVVSVIEGEFATEKAIFKKFPSLATPNPEIEIHWSQRDRGSEIRGVETLRFDRSDPTLAYFSNRLLPVRVSGGLSQFLGVAQGVDLESFAQRVLDRRITNFHTDDLDEVIIQKDCFEMEKKLNQKLPSVFYAKRGGVIWEVHKENIRDSAPVHQIPTATMDDFLDAFTETEYEGFLAQSVTEHSFLDLQQAFQSNEEEKNLEAFCRVSLKGRLDTKETLRLFRKAQESEGTSEMPVYIGKLEGRSENLIFYVSQNKWRTTLQSLAALWRDSQKSQIPKASLQRTAVGK